MSTTPFGDAMIELVFFEGTPFGPLEPDKQKSFFGAMMIAKASSLTF